MLFAGGEGAITDDSENLFRESVFGRGGARSSASHGNTVEQELLPVGVEGEQMLAPQHTVFGIFFAESDVGSTAFSVRTVVGKEDVKALRKIKGGEHSHVSDAVTEVAVQQQNSGAARLFGAQKRAEERLTVGVFQAQFFGLLGSDEFVVRPRSRLLHCLFFAFVSVCEFGKDSVPEQQIKNAKKRCDSQKNIKGGHAISFGISVLHYITLRYKINDAEKFVAKMCFLFYNTFIDFPSLHVKIDCYGEMFMKQKVLAIVFAALMFVSACLSAIVVTAADATDEIDILCVGESLTCGSGANEAGTITEPKKDSSGNIVYDEYGDPVMVNSKINNLLTFPFRLDKQLGYGYNVLNYGISGVSVLPEYKWTWAAGGYLEAAKNNSSANPFNTKEGVTVDYIAVMLGTNDAKDRIWKAEQGTGGAENFYLEYTKMIQEFLAIPTNPQVICVIPPPAVNGAGLNDYEIVEETLRDEISPIIRRVAAENHCMCLDLREVFPDPVTEREELLALYAVDDGVHPNKDGYELIADALMPYIHRVGGDVDGSGALSSNDLQNLGQHLAGWPAVADALNSDVDLNGAVDVNDLVLIAQYLAGWDVKLY